MERNKNKEEHVSLLYNLHIGKTQHIQTLKSRSKHN